MTFLSIRLLKEGEGGGEVDTTPDLILGVEREGVVGTLVIPAFEMSPLAS